MQQAGEEVATRRLALTCGQDAKLQLQYLRTLFRNHPGHSPATNAKIRVLKGICKARAPPPREGGREEEAQEHEADSPEQPPQEEAQEHQADSRLDRAPTQAWTVSSSSGAA